MNVFPQYTEIADSIKHRKVEELLFFHEYSNIVVDHFIAAGFVACSFEMQSFK